MRYLLVIDPGGRVMLADVDTGARVEVGAGLPPIAPTDRSPARTAVWSPAGQWTAWSVDADPTEPAGGAGAEELGALDGVHEIRLHHERTDSVQIVAASLTALYLSPSPCGRFLSHLSPGPLGLELGVSDVRTGELRIIERGQPLFWAWSPDGSELAVHVGDRVLVAPLDGEAQLLSDGVGSFVAPAWTADGSVVFVADDQIVSHAPDGARSVLAIDGGPGRFALDPDGRRLAHVAVLDGAAALVVADLLTGERTVVAAERTAAFFWSPEGRHLAVLVLAGPTQLQWLVWDGARTERLEPFRPGPSWLREVLPFFEQYAHSHAVWSADGTQLVAAGLDADGSSEAVVQSVRGPMHTERLPGARLAWWAND